MSTPIDDVTIDPLRNAATTGVVTPPPSGSSRFAPGSIVVGRYRLVALLGKGGMGEVYRADDLTLDQPVALKFLPEGVAANDARLAQFHNELRIARQVSHKNVCRLYDLGDTDGRRFLTMEYVDGEDLSASLRRFGRIPPDKAIQIARQLCAGITAAHEKGVLHRDLKPANVMLDGNGDVRITDFGIATAAADAASGGVVGTPHYMAPELLAGRAASAKSDIYALGLILFEVFTGKRAYEAKTLGELKQLHDTGTVTTPSSIVHDLDPAVERVILRCLEKDPEKRPGSALTVAASLPGGDPLAAALAAGETPSPELLVAAGESEAMPVRRALAIAAACLVGLLASIAPLTRGSLVGHVSLPIPRDALADRGNQIIRKLGYVGPFADRAMGFSSDAGYLRWEENNGPRDWWNRLRGGRPVPMLFWYRTSPREMVPSSPGSVQIGDPPMTVAGMQQLWLDAEGRVVEYHAVPPEVMSTPPAASPPWPAMFETADLDSTAFTPVAPQFTPRDFADATAAWEGPMPGHADRRIRIEAASFKNRPVSFQIVWPWTESARPADPPRSRLQKLTDLISVGVFVAMMLGGGLLARHNLRLNRADRRGAARFAIILTIASLAARLLTASHSTTPGTEIGLQIIGNLAFAGFTGGLTWVFYLAIEPYARRFWPDAILAWTRLLSGRVRDPRVGRELLIGLSFGVLSLLVVEIPKLIATAPGLRMPQFPLGSSSWVLLGMPSLTAFWLNNAIGGLQSALSVAMIFLMLRLILKRPRLALVAGLVLLSVASNGGNAISGTWIDSYNTVAFTFVMAYVIHRFGLLAMATTLFIDNIVADAPLTTDLSVWWSTPTTLTVVLVTGMVCFAYYAARAGQPLFGRVLEE